MDTTIHNRHYDNSYINEQFIEKIVNLHKEEKYQA